MAQGDVIRSSIEGFDPENVSLTYGSDDTSQPVEFYFNEVAQKDFCKMVFPGNKLTVWDQPVREKDKLRFPTQWRLYKEGKDQLSGQTHLQSWGAIDPGSIEIYRGLHIMTVEQLAGVSDANMSQMPPGHSHLAHRHRDMARKHLEEKRQSVGFDQAIQAAKDSQDMAERALAEKDQLAGQVAELQKRLDAAEAEKAQPKRRGRPPKKDSEAA